MEHPLAEKMARALVEHAEELTLETSKQKHDGFVAHYLVDDGGVYVAGPKFRELFELAFVACIQGRDESAIELLKAHTRGQM